MGIPHSLYIFHALGDQRCPEAALLSSVLTHLIKSLTMGYTSRPTLGGLGRQQAPATLGRAMQSSPLQPSLGHQATYFSSFDAGEGLECSAAKCQQGMQSRGARAGGRGCSPWDSQAKPTLIVSWVSGSQHETALRAAMVRRPQRTPVQALPRGEGSVPHPSLHSNHISAHLSHRVRQMSS